MTPRYEWTPASEPPDTDRFVVVWYGSNWCIGFYEDGGWSHPTATYWRDVEPPTAAPHTDKEKA